MRAELSRRKLTLSFDMIASVNLGSETSGSRQQILESGAVLQNQADEAGFPIVGVRA